MLTSTTPTSRPAARGFTLLEILVVVAIIGVLASVVTLSIGSGNLEQELRGEAERAALRIELARSNALQRNREWGLLVEDRRYQFVELDPIAARWNVHGAEPLGLIPMPSGISLRLETEGFQLPVLGDENEDARDDDDEEKPLLPNLLVFSSGEVTPFTLSFVPEWDAEPWQVSSDGLSRVTAARDEVIAP